jgi:hypothetical protein
LNNVSLLKKKGLIDCSCELAWGKVNYYWSDEAAAELLEKRWMMMTMMEAEYVTMEEGVIRVGGGVDGLEYVVAEVEALGCLNGCYEQLAKIFVLDFYLLEELMGMDPAVGLPAVENFVAYEASLG